MSIDLIISELQGSKIRRTQDGRFSVYDIIRIAGGQKNPHQVWKRLLEAYPELLTACEFYKFTGKGRNNTPVATPEIDRRSWESTLEFIQKHRIQV